MAYGATGSHSWRVLPVPMQGWAARSCTKLNQLPDVPTLLPLLPALLNQVQCRLSGFSRLLMVEGFAYACVSAGSRELCHCCFLQLLSPGYSMGAAFSWWGAALGLGMCKLYLCCHHFLPLCYTPAAAWAQLPTGGQLCWGRAAFSCVCSTLRSMREGKGAVQV